MSDCYYRLLDESDALGQRIRATEMTRGVWSAANQNAGPVSAILVRALERCQARDDTRLSRVMVDLLGGVPVQGDLWVRSRIERSGKQIELVSAQMLARGADGDPRAVASASGWRLKIIDAAELVHAPAPLPAPIANGWSRNLEKDYDLNFVHSVDWRWLTQPLSDGPGECWIRPLVGLVEGEEMTSLQRLFTVADCANGMGSKLDIAMWTFMNTDLVVHLHRLPEGEWTGIRAETDYGPDGIAATIGTLFDETGAVGVIQQSVLLRPTPSK